MAATKSDLSDEQLAILIADANALASSGGTVSMSESDVVNLRAALLELQARRYAKARLSVAT